LRRLFSCTVLRSGLHSFVDALFLALIHAWLMACGVGKGYSSVRCFAMYCLSMSAVRVFSL